MQNFKTFLKENQHYPWQVQTIEQLLELPNWQKLNVGNEYVAFVLPSTGEIAIEGDFKNGILHIEQNSNFILYDDIFIQYQGGYYLPCKMSGDLQTLSLQGSSLTSLIGMEDLSIIRFALGNNNNLKNLEGFPSIVNTLTLDKTFPITSHLDKYVKKLEEIVILERETDYKGWLSCLKIKSLEIVSVGFFNNTPKMKMLAGIITKYLKGSRDLLSCQEELIENGLKEYAKL